MQEWMIAMLVLSMLLILRDMAKTVLKGRISKNSSFISCEEIHPQKEKINKYAESFQKLADTFYGLPYKTEYLSKGQIRSILCSAQENVCNKCYQRELCWSEQQKEMYQTGENIIRIIESGDELQYERAKNDWMSICGKAVRFMEILYEGFKRERQNLIWDNRMIESRFAIAQQLTEVAGILRQATSDLYDLEKASQVFSTDIKKKLRRYQILIKDIWVLEKKEGHRIIFLEMRVRNGQCVSMTEISQAISSVCKTRMIPASDSRYIINTEFHLFQFVEDVSYQIVYGISRLTREKETISGDSYICRQEEDGRFVMCLSDGMGSGADASKESEMVVELMEQFMESGFSQETAARMINSTLLLNGQEELFSTVDLCAIDLYTGICNFLKAGAVATFIKRDHWVEAITSESLAAGILQQVEFDTTSRKLYHGDYIIMMTDGVIDALPQEKEESLMKEIILDIQNSTPKEISRGIIERVLGYCDYRARDDMTVLVAGMWKK